MRNLVRLSLFATALSGVLWLGFHGLQVTQAAEWKLDTQQAAGQGAGLGAVPAGGQTIGPAAAGQGQGGARRFGPPPMSPEMRAHIDAGEATFQQNCAFCHGRDAGGGETGPDLTRAKSVLDDNNGDKISAIIHNGFPGRMPAFPLSDTDTSNVVAFLHNQQAKAKASGQRKGVDPSDLLTGNAEAGKQYFEGAGGCAKCHSATGDLAHVGSKYQGLQLEMRMLYPRGAKGKATVTLASGEKVTGTIEVHDEFTLGILLPDGSYRSWPTEHLKYTLDEPAEAHGALFSKYSDADIHNIYAYLQGLR
jgi:cytochrome c oxidase cbb3-type subunit III